MRPMLRRSDLQSPCKGCPKRQPRCHGSCEEYQAWTKTLPRTDYVQAGLMDSRRAIVGKAAKRHQNKGKWRFGK